MFGVDDFIVGMVGGSIIDAFAGHSANQANIAAANANRNFSRNAHQIEVEDLYKAGLNPLLSAKYSGANLSGGTMPNVEPIARDTAGKLTSAFAARAQARLAESGITKNDAEANLADANAAKSRTEEQILRRGLTGGRVEAEIGKTRQETETSASTAVHNRTQALKNVQEVKNLVQELKNLESSNRLTEANIREVAEKTVLQHMDHKLKSATVNQLIDEINAKAINVTAENAAAWVRALAESGFSKDDVIRIAQATGIAFLLKQPTVINKYYR